MLEAYAASLRVVSGFRWTGASGSARFREEMVDHVGETMELEVAITDELLDGLEGQLAAVEEEVAN